MLSIFIKNSINQNQDIDYTHHILQTIDILHILSVIIFIAILPFYIYELFKD